MKDALTVILTVLVFAVLATGFVILNTGVPVSAAIEVGLMTSLLGMIITMVALLFLAISGKPDLNDPLIYALAHGVAGGLMFVGGVGILGALLVAAFGLVSGLIGSLAAKLLCLYVR